MNFSLEHGRGCRQIDAVPGLTVPRFAEAKLNRFVRPIEVNPKGAFGAVNFHMNRVGTSRRPARSMRQAHGRRRQIVNLNGGVVGIKLLAVVRGHASAIGHNFWESRQVASYCRQVFGTCRGQIQQMTTEIAQHSARSF